MIDIISALIESLAQTKKWRTENTRFVAWWNAKSRCPKFRCFSEQQFSELMSWK